MPDRPEEGWSFKKMALGALAFVGVGVAAVAAGPAVVAAAGSMASAASAYFELGITIVLKFGWTVINTGIGTAEIAEVVPIVLASIGRAASYLR